MSEQFMSPKRLREQTLLQNLGALEKFAYFGDVRAVWLCPLLRNSPITWVLVYVTSTMEPVSDFVRLCKQNGEGSELAPETVRINTLDELLGGRLREWPVADLISDVLFLPSNWREYNVKSHLATVYGFPDSEYLDSLKSFGNKAIYVLGD